MKACAWCAHYNPQSYLVRTVERNVSGNKVWYRRWCKNRCLLRQEDRYPNGCDFEEDLQRSKEAEKRDDRIMKERSLMNLIV